MSDDPDWDLFVDNTIANGIQSTNDFKAGKINECLKFWKSLAIYSKILSLIRGTFIELDGKIVQGQNRVEPYFFLPSITQKINFEIQKMLKKRYCVFNYTKPRQLCLSNIF